MWLPFPSLLTHPSDRMKLGAGRVFEHVGRECFKIIYDRALKCALDTESPHLNVYGTKGFGKSFRISALATLFLKQVSVSPCCFCMFDL